MRLPLRRPPRRHRLRHRILGRQATAYKRTFTGADGDLVLLDLARFCHAYLTTHLEGDPHGSALLAGRREVFLRIVEFMRLDPGDIIDAVKRGQEREADLE